MTRRDFILKWAMYGLALFPVWWLEVYVLSRLPVFGVIPVILPLCAVAVAVMEGSAAGAGFGLCVGILCDAVYFGTHGTMTLALTLAGWAAGAAATYVLDRNFLGCFVCSLATLGTLGFGRVFVRTFTGMAPLPVLLSVAGPELLWSVLFLIPIYPWFHFVRRRIRKTLRL